MSASRTMAGRLLAAGVAMVLAAGLAACDQGPPERPVAYKGEYHYGAGQAPYLAQLGVEARICIEESVMVAAVQPEFVAGGGISQVVVRGMLSRAGKYGTEGQCAFELTSAELLGVGERNQR